MALESNITTWINSLRESTEKRFFLGYIRESATTDAEYDKPVAFRVCLFGRAHRSDIHLSDNYCSRHHALIYFNEGTPMIRDLDSRTGTTVNNIVLVGGRDYPLSHGDIISIVGQRFAFIYEEEKPQEHTVDKGLPVVSMATHSCPYCQKFIPEFSVELEALQQQTSRVLEEILAMETSYRTSRITTEKLLEKIELVKHHHDAYHHELLVEAKERRIQELEATKIADASVVVGRSRIVMEDNVRTEDGDSDSDREDENKVDVNVVEPSLKKRESLNVDDLALSRAKAGANAPEKPKKRVAFLQKSQHIGETERKGSLLGSIVSSMAFWRKSTPAVDKAKEEVPEESDSSFVPRDREDSGESGESSDASGSGSDESDNESSSGSDENEDGHEHIEMRSYNGPGRVTAGAEKTEIKPKPKGKDTPAPPRYEFDDESED